VPLDQVPGRVRFVEYEDGEEVDDEENASDTNTEKG
jgi:hypothetical protein